MRASTPCSAAWSGNRPVRVAPPPGALPIASGANHSAHSSPSGSSIQIWYLPLLPKQRLQPVGVDLGRLDRQPVAVLGEVLDAAAVALGGALGRERVFVAPQH